MLKKAVLPAIVVLAAVAFSAGCTKAPTPGAGSPAATAEPFSTSSAEAAPSATAVASTTSNKPAPPEKPVPRRTSDAGDGGNFNAALRGCPHEGQRVEVQKMVWADVTGDGVDDVFVVRTCEASTSYNPSTVEVFDGAAGGEKPRRVGTLLEDVGQADVPWHTSITVTGDRVVVTAHGLSRSGVPACPDLKLTYTYEYGGGEFTRTDRKATKSADCLRVG